MLEWEFCNVVGPSFRCISNRSPICAILSATRMISTFIFIFFVASWCSNGVQSFKVSSISPSHGSIGGKTLVTITGSDFSPDLYSKGTTVRIGGIPCVVEWFLSGANTIACKTPVNPWAEEGRSFSVGIEVLVGNDRDNSKSFTYRWGSTPRVLKIQPSAVPVGSDIAILTENLPADPESISHVFVGDQICNLRDTDGTNAYYGVFADSGNSRYTWINCRVQQNIPGLYNVSVELRTMGLTWNSSHSLFVGPEEKLAMLELFPRVNEVTPQVGSVEGGTVLTINGAGFDPNPALVEVDVDGVPCDVLSSTLNQIVCRTGKPPANHPSIADYNYEYTDVADGYRFKGSRGVSVEQYPGVNSNINSLLGSANFPHNPDMYLTYPTFEPPESSRRDNFGERYSAFFTPLMSGEQRLWSASDDSSELLLSRTSNISDATRIAYLNGHNSWWNRYTGDLSWGNWRRYPTQRADPMVLYSNESYLLVGHLAEGGASDFFRVGVHYASTDYKYNETKQSVREEQYFTLETDTARETQKLTVLVNVTTLDVESPPTVEISWGGRTTPPMSVFDLNDTDLVEKRIMDLFQAECEFEQTDIADVTYFDFESGAAWPRWSGVTPTIVEYEQYCGLNSIMVRDDGAKPFDLGPSDDRQFDLEEYPYLCMAYKIPPGLNVVVPIKLKVDSNSYRWYDIPITGPEKLTFSEEIADDDQWHYNCYNFEYHVKNDSGLQNEEFIVLGMGFYFKPVGSSTTLFFDDVAFVSSKRELKQRVPPSRPNGMALHTVDVDLYETHPNADIWNVTLVMEILPSLCDYDIPLMAVSVQDTTDTVQEASFDRLQNASLPLGGQYTLKFNGIETRPLDYDASAYQARQALLEKAPYIESLSSWTTPLPADVLKRYCPGRRLSFRFERLPGDQPFIEVNVANLTGSDVKVSYTESWQGGLFVRPLRGFMLQTAEIYPQVHVRVRGHLSSCGAVSIPTTSRPETCKFLYSFRNTPNVTFVDPGMVRKGDDVAIIGEGFGDSSELVDIHLGDTPCNITFVNDTLIICTVQSSSSGPKRVQVLVSPSGRAAIPDLFIDYNVTIDGISPSDVSLGGGSTVKISGSGFLDDECRKMSASCECSDVSVFIGGMEANVLSSSKTEIVCTTPPSSTRAEETVSVTVLIGCDDGSVYSDSLVDGISYLNNSAVITSIEPVVGTAGGGTVVNIAGQNLPTNSDDITVMIGDGLCSVISATPTSVSCVTSPHSPGNFTVDVRVEGMGNALPPEGGLLFTYVLEVHNVSHCYGSLFGGQAVEITGDGFGTNSSAVRVSFGGTTCDVFNVTMTSVKCTTRSSSSVHIITNNAVNDMYGLGYKWTPEELTIHVGDTVTWSWTGVPFAQWFSVAQVPTEHSMGYVGHGFRSDSSVIGNFSFTFYHHGVYHYIADNYAHIGMRGTVTVLSPKDKEVPIALSVNGITAPFVEDIVCDVPTSCMGETSLIQDDHFYQGNCSTPVIEAIEPGTAHPGDHILISVVQVSSSPADNLITVGGLVCEFSNGSLYGGIELLEQFQSVSDPPQDLMSTVINCTLPRSLSPGSYWVQLHVKGLGFEYASGNNSRLIIQPVVYDIEPSSGSLRGQTLVKVTGLGFSKDPGENRVLIGNSPCFSHHVSTNTDGLDELFCYTLNSVDDGYSSIVRRSGPTGYWTFQSVYYYYDGTYSSSDFPTIRNHGSIGSLANGNERNRVLKEQVGISGNAFTDQSIALNPGSVEVPFTKSLFGIFSYSVELWLRTNDGTHSFAGDYTSVSSYRILLSSFSEFNKTNTGFFIVLNPCEEIELWYSPGFVDEVFSADCQPIASDDKCPSSCFGLYQVGEGHGSSLPSGLWNVLSGTEIGITTTNWTHVVVVWNSLEMGPSGNLLGLPSDAISDSLTNPLCSLLDSGVNSCLGSWSLYMNGLLQNDTSLTNYSHNVDGNLHLSGNGQGYYVGYLDEVAVYPTALSDEDVSEHYRLGTGEDQPVFISVEGKKDVRQNGVFSSSAISHYSTMDVDWNIAQNEREIHLNSHTIITFQWNSSTHGVYQVDQLAYKTCNLSNGVVWHRSTAEGTVSIAFKENRTWYLVDAVEHNCRNGYKLSVKVGNIHEIVWGIPGEGEAYEDVTVSKDTTLFFKWTTGYHNLVEIRNVPTRDVCEFANRGSTGASQVGQVEKEWKGAPSSTGEVHVSGLSVGEHHFVCTVATHCVRGMKVRVIVTEDDNSTTEYKQPSDSDTVSVFWAIQEYPTLEIHDRTNILFVWNDFHSLLQVTADAYDECDTDPVHTLVEWYRPSVDTSVIVPHLSPGTYYFICGVAGHCSAGMKLKVVVYPLPIAPPLMTPVEAACTGSCVFAYSPVETPRLENIDPVHGRGGTVIQINGTGFVDEGGSAAMVTVFTGGIPCRNVTAVGVVGGTESIECVVEDFESGFYFVDVVVSNYGLAAVYDIDSPVYGPHRNLSELPRQNSPYPVFFLAATVVSIAPSTGSLNGGTAVTISGSGFSYFTAHVQVLLGNCVCVVSSSSLSTITCLTTYCDDIDTSAMNNVSLPVKVNVNGYPASSSVFFLYSHLATPVVNRIEASSSVTEGDNITVVGEQLDGDSVDVRLYNQIEESIVGDCTVVFSNATVVVCTVPPLSASIYKVVLSIVETGLSVEGSEGSANVMYGLTVNNFHPAVSGSGGGVTLTIGGSGFPPSGVMANLLVSICGVPCLVLSSSFSSIDCEVGPRETSDPFADSVQCSVNVTIDNIFVASDELFTYNGTLTPYINGLSPTFGGTAGGTIVTISGWGFWPPNVTSSNELAVNDISVHIDSVQCVLNGTITLDTLYCRTSSHRTVIKAKVAVHVRGRGAAIDRDSLGFFDYIDKWSSRFTWGGDPPPLEGETVYIQAGQTVFLDTDTPVLNLILIEGCLIFEDSQDVHLQAKYIFVNTGKLQVGTEENPFMHRAVITLHGTVRDSEIPVYGAKVIGVRQGDLDLHGRPRNVTWTRLQATAVANDTFLLLEEPVDWVEGDNIVIAPTSKDGNETEVGVVQSVGQNGYRINLVNALKYTHFGITETFDDGQFIEIRAEVGLLSHNVVIQGSMLEDSSGHFEQGADMFGAQVLIHRAGPHPTPIRIEHTEVRHMGQAFRLGRYALHFHLSGSMNGSYIRNCAIHHSFNRAITAHGVHDVLIEGNVAYDIMGHTYFVEDGIETDNSYIHNLGVLTRGSSSLLNTDQIPATFWITNPQNVFKDNAAAASRAYGFWYDLDNFPSGPSFTTSVCPNKMPFGVFENNVAHTCSEFGLRIWETYVPYADGCQARTRTTARLYNFTTYNNGIHGLEFSIVGDVQIHGFKLSDNRDNGIEIQETLGDWGGPLIKDALVVSHTRANSGAPGTGGIKTPNTRGLTISNVTFVNFNATGSSCLRACSHCKVFQGGFQVWFNGIKYLGQSDLNKVAFKWEHEVLYWDQDGTLSGNVGGWVLPNSGLLPNGPCQLAVPEFSVGTHPGAACTSEVYFLRMAWNNAQPLTTLMGVDVNVTNEFGYSRVPWRHYRLTHLDGYMFVFPSGYNHSIEWLLPVEHEVDTTHYSAGVYEVHPSDRAWITHSFVNVPDHVEVGRNYEGLDEFPDENQERWSWYMDNSTNITQVTYLVSGINQTEDLTDYTFTYNYRPCPRSGCPTVRIDRGPLEQEYRLWSNESSWPSGKVPAEGEDVTIMSTWRMLLDVSPPPLGRVYVFGELMFQNEQDLNLTANLILVTGFNGRLVVGTEDSPFQHEAIITLTGRRGTPDLALARNMNLGSKALGVFGNVSLVGKPVRAWSKLLSSASSGSLEIRVEDLPNLKWPVGGEIVVASSSYDPTEAEIRRIVSIDGDNITLDRALDYNHNIVTMIPSAEIPSDGSWSFGDLNYAPEVGLLTRNIVVQGGEDSEEPLEHHHYGCRVLIGQYKYDDNEDFVGKAEFASVEFRYCGQGGYFSPFDPRYAIVFKDLLSDSQGNYVHNCSIHHGYNTAVGVHRSNEVDIDGNVVYRTTDSSFQIGGSRNRVVNNLAILTSTVQPNAPLDNHAVDFPASFEVDEGNTLRNNHAAGSTRTGFQYHGESCRNGHLSTSEEMALFWGNTAHSCLTGLLVMGIPARCTAVGGFTSYLSWDYGVFSSIASRLVVSHSVIASGKVGLNLNVFGPNPVAHLLGRKWVKLENTLIVGITEGERCLSSSPPHAVPGVSSSHRDHKHGIMMSSFNQKRSKMSGTGPFHLMKGYPVIDGRLEVTNVTFARFLPLDGCSYQPFAITNNPLSPDAVHPTEVRGAVKINVDRAHIAHYYPPNPEWINQEDCIDMDCDGPKHALIQDIDGSLLDNAPFKASIIPFAQLRFDYSRIPNTWWANEGFPLRSDLVDEKGIDRGTEEDTSPVGCEWVNTANAYYCVNITHYMLVFESMDPDTEVRRLSPIALVGGDTARDEYTDLLNGPMDHGWCTYYTCLKRLSTFFSIVSLGPRSEFHIWATATNPKGLRFHILNAPPDEGVLLHIWFQDTFRKDVYKNGIYIASANTKYTTNGAAYEESDPSFVPSYDSFSGDNYFDRNTQILHLLVKGDTPIEIRTPPVVIVSLTVSVSFEDFFSPEALLLNLAFVLRIPLSSIRQVNVIPEDSPISRRRRQSSAGNDTMEITLELGSRPEINRSSPGVSTVEEQLNGTNTESVDNGSSQEAELTNGTGIVTDTQPEVVSDNIYNDDPPPDDEAYLNEYEEQEVAYEGQVGDYMEAVQEAIAANDIAETFVMLIQTQSLQLDNVTVTEVSIQPAVVPPPPEPPVVPPEYNTTVETPATPVEAYNPVKSGDSNGSKLSIFTPHRIVLTHHPPKETGNLVYIQVEARDEKGLVVQHLGISQPWQCVASVIQGTTSDGSLPTLGGTTNVSFVNGRATFTRLRINEISDNVLLQLSTKPGNLQESTTTPLSVVPPPSTTPRIIVHFKLTGEYSTIELDLQGFVNAVKRALATALDVDISRLQDIKLFDLDNIAVQLELLDVLEYDPPDTPSLSASLSLLRSIVNSKTFSFSYQNNIYTSVEGSFVEGPVIIPDHTTIALIAGLCSAGALCLLVVAAIVCFCGCKLRKNTSKNKVSASAIPVHQEETNNDFAFKNAGYENEEEREAFELSYVESSVSMNTEKSLVNHEASHAKMQPHTCRPSLLDHNEWDTGQQTPTRIVHVSPYKQQ